MTDKEKTQLQKEILDSLNPNPHGRLLLAPRSGKTKVIINLIKRDKPNKILWITPSSKLADEDIPTEFIKWKAKKYLKNLTTVTWMSLHKMKGYYNLIVLDEEQFATENNIKPLLNDTLKYNNIISMTGSSTEREEKKELYRLLKLRVLYEISINHAVNIGLLSNYKIYVITTNMSFEKNVLAGNKKNRFYTSEIKNYEYLSLQIARAIQYGDKNIKFKILNRMRAVKNSPAKHKVAEYLMKNLKGRKLFFCSSIKQAEELCINFYHSKSNNIALHKFINGDIDTITMVNAGGTGFTYEKIDHLVIVQADSNKNGLTGQKIARTLMKQKDYFAHIWIIQLNDTQDVKWINSTLESFDFNKVEYIKFENLKL